MIIGLLVVVQLQAQENNVFTKSVPIETFIPFVVNKIKKSIASTKTRNYTFLIPTSFSNDITENTVLLKQGFRLLSDKLNENDQITLIAYAAYNGEFLKATSAESKKKILFVLNNIEESIAVKVTDGLQLGYDTADINFDSNAINTIVLIRDSNTNNNIVSARNKAAVKPEKKDKKKTTNAVLLTLISLAPEVIRVLKGL